MSKHEVVRTYTIEVDDKALSHIRALGGSSGDLLVAITYMADMGNVSGTAHMIYVYDEDAEMGTYEFLPPGDYDERVTLVAEVDYGVTETINKV